MNTKILFVILVSTLSFDIFAAETGRLPKPDYDFIAWDAHRFSKTPEDVVRDARWLKDLGFTHSFCDDIGYAGIDIWDRYAAKMAAQATNAVTVVPVPKSTTPAPDEKSLSQEETETASVENIVEPEKPAGNAPGTKVKLSPQEMNRARINAFADVGLLGGCKPYLPHRGSESANMLGNPSKDDLGKKGQLIAMSPEKISGPLNLVHPDNVRILSDYYFNHIKDRIQDDPRGVMRLFLMGTEMKWMLPSKDAISYAKPAIDVIMAAAIEDGIVKPGEPYDPTNERLFDWWYSPYGHGKCWRLRQAFEEKVLKIIPEADFMVDPTYSIKIVNGFGASWAYIKNDPKWMGVAASNVKELCWPHPGALSVQLTNGAGPDTVMEGNLIALAMGIEKLYHWGVHYLEPGATVEWGINHQLSKDKSLSKEEKAKRAAVMIKEQAAEFDRKTHEKRKMEPSIRSTGRLIQARGAMFRDWKLAGTRLAVVGCGGRGNGPTAILIDANIPFDALSRENMVKNLKNYKYCLIARDHYFQDQIEALNKFADTGGTIIIADDHAGDAKQSKEASAKSLPESLPTFKNALRWSILSEGEGPELFGKKAGMTISSYFMLASGLDADKWDAALSKKSVSLKKLLMDHGFPFYCDTNNKDLVLQPFDYQGQRIIMAVNDKRDVEVKVASEEEEDTDEEELIAGAQEEGAGGTEKAKKKAPAAPQKKPKFLQKKKGLPNDVDIVVHEPGDVQVINIDTGKPVKTTGGGGTIHIIDTIEPAWYRLYAILKKGETWKGGGPIPEAPAIKTLAVTYNTAKKGVELKWELPFDAEKDWVGCEVQRYEIFRAPKGVSPTLVANIHGRPMKGDGGVVTSYFDKDGHEGDVYQIRAISPLRALGPMSQQVASVLK